MATARIYSGAYANLKCVVCDADSTHWAKVRTSSASGMLIETEVQSCGVQLHQKAAGKLAEAEAEILKLRLADVTGGEYEIGIDLSPLETD